MVHAQPEVRGRKRLIVVASAPLGPARPAAAVEQVQQEDGEEGDADAQQHEVAASPREPVSRRSLGGVSRGRHGCGLRLNLTRCNRLAEYSPAVLVQLREDGHNRYK
jgi:hypothetical protein